MGPLALTRLVRWREHIPVRETWRRKRERKGVGPVTHSLPLP